MTNIVVKTDKRHRDSVLDNLRNEILDKIFNSAECFDISYYELMGLISEIKSECINTLNNNSGEDGSI